MSGDASRRLAAQAGIAFCLSACVACIAGDQVVSPTTSYVIVHAVLDMGSRDQSVVLERTRSGQPRTHPPVFVGGGEPLPGAQVTLTTPDGAVLAAEEDTLHDGTPAQNGFYRIKLDRYGVSLVPGGSYTLRVRVPSGEEVMGTTTIPRAVAATPSDSEMFDLRDSLRLVWSPVEDAAAHEVRFHSQFAQSGCCYDVEYAVFAESTFSISGLAKTIWNDPVFLSHGVTVVTVAAVDANYYEYFRTVSDPFVGAPPSRLTGGVGVFGSLVPLSIRTLKVR